MSSASEAIEDLRFGLDIAAERYRSFSEQIDYEGAARLVDALADERDFDAQALTDAAHQAELPMADPTLDRRTAAKLLWLGTGEVDDAASAMFRVQRAENQLGHMAAQLASLIETPVVHQNPGDHRQIRIGSRKAEISEMRRRVRRRFGAAGAGRALTHALPLPDRPWMFGSARTRVGDAARGFGPARADVVSYGRCNVFVPDGRRVGSLGSGIIGRIMHGEDRIQVQTINTLGQSAFWSHMHEASQLVEASDHTGLVFLHGYKTKFDDAARRTAQLKG